MRKLSLFLSLFSVASLLGQMNDGGLPYTFNQKKINTLKSTESIPVFRTKSLDVNMLLAEDKEFPTPQRYSVFEDVAISIKDIGLKTELSDNKGTIWRYRIDGQGTKSLQTYFSKYKIPEGAKLFIYNPDYSKIAGAFTHINNNQNNSLMIADFTGSDLIIEYFEPQEIEFEGELIISAIGKGYKIISEKASSVDENGFLNINCPEGEDWQDNKHAVCKITFRDGSFGYTCSGSLINNTRNDGTPYFITANHCLSSTSVAETVVGYFNYEELGCSDNLKDVVQTLSGTALRSTGTESDFTLLEFNNPPPLTYQPFYAGWDASGKSGSSAVCIHHPGGDPKKISVENDPPVSYAYRINWEDDIITPGHSHWSVKFELGRTIEGSSGSPLYNNSGLFIGQLHGGDDIDNYYGKLSHSWKNSDNNFQPLQFYLDPDNSGVQVLDAYYPTDITPDPQFYADFNAVCTYAPLNLNGYSAFDPIKWEWSFTPNYVTYLNGTSSESKNPELMFTSKGSYSVSLKVTNNNSSATLIRENFIVADTSLNLQVHPETMTDSCLCNIDSLLLNGYGASNFSWSLNQEMKDIFYIIDTTNNPVVLKPYPEKLPNQSIDLSIKVKGIHGSCIAYKDYTIPLLAQENDLISNALLINEGQNGIFSNKCSSIQENEPVPPFSSCTGQDSWCDEYGTGQDIIENSVWFYFIAQKDKKLQLSSKGFDNQIAIYEADSYQDILDGNYNRIGANDDYTQFNSNPIITNLTVEKGTTYWVQVDGSGGGLEGNFYLYLEETSNISLDKPENDSELLVYPIPSKDIVNITCNDFIDQKDIGVELYNLSGQTVFLHKIVSHSGNRLELDLTSLQKGVYFTRIVINDQVYTTQIVKQ